MLEHEGPPADEFVAPVATVREAVAHEVEAHGTEAGVEEVLQNDVAGVFVAH